jgi:mono/diheme cytochrome c family protein
MKRCAALFSGLLAAVVWLPANLSGNTRAQEQKPQEERKSEQKTPESKEKPAGEAKAVSKIPAEESQRPNTVKPDADSLAQGKHMFTSQCAMCHGTAGDGKGDLAEDMKLKLTDYRDPEGLKGFTDGDLFYILTHGKGQMPDQGDRLTATQKWNLINYIRSLAKKATPEKPEKPEKLEKKASPPAS